MRFYTQQHKHYCGIDLHGRKMYVCIISHRGKVWCRRDNPDALTSMMEDASWNERVVCQEI